MKKFTVLLFAVCMSFVCKAQEFVWVPDQAFEQYLINMGFDDVQDGEVARANVQEVRVLDVYSFENEIRDLTGIEAFEGLEELTIVGVNLDLPLMLDQQNLAVLNVWSSWVTSAHLDLPSLERLDVQDSQLSNFQHSVYNLPSLRYFDAGRGTGITDLTPFPLLDTLIFTAQGSPVELSNNTVLRYLEISETSDITSLDLSALSNLGTLKMKTCNQLATLNLANGANQNLQQLNLTKLPALSCIQVDDAQWSQDNWVGENFVNANNVRYSTDCACTPAQGVDVVTACESYTWEDGQVYTASNNTANFILYGGAQNGCDSIVTLNLTINNATSGTDVVTACGSYEWIDGMTYTASTTSPTFTLTNANGCDSVVTLDLTINSVSDITIENLGGTLTANNTEASYQWVDCNDDSAIEGETNQSFVPSGSGTYAVELTENGCVAKSECVNVTLTSIQDRLFGGISVYPNPSNGHFNVDLGSENAEKISLLNMQGELLYDLGKMSGNSYQLDLPEGMYLLEVQIQGQTKNYKVMIH